MSANRTKEEGSIKYQLDRLAVITELVKKDTSIETKELQVEMIELLIATKSSNDLLMVKKTRDYALITLGSVISR